MRTVLLILPVKGHILRTQGEGGENGSNCADVLYGRPLGLPLLWMLNTKYFVCFLNTLFVAKQGYFKLVFSKNCGT